MDEYQLFSLLPQSIGVIANLLIVGATVYAIATRPSVATGLMLFGAFARLVCGVFFSFGIYFFDNDYERYTKVVMPFQILVYLGIVAFIVGFFVFAYKLFSTPAEV
ncbi:hypothetical protein KK062_05555 [Fulvivirgaceae bacterium PWU5]|uniref:Uncharacterized protein n=1 Tax=Dawidia cretensis TaxID=2782350 RepID=A0AAP2DUB0_9BACT|nr:hypothetical protein [Dawidia cretensis]MBT1707675.1 hypothetical protein [Dawidia cretensis]